MSAAQYHDDEGMIAQCLVSMADKGHQFSADDPPQRDEPPSVSEDDDSLDTKTTSQLNKRIKIENMIAATALPDANQWENEKYSSPQG